uniref:Uncharacterized protein n=1 Tax=Rhizophora mucronata TaxID=61149 RepID=A0A2P2IY44_RHIMU
MLTSLHCDPEVKSLSLKNSLFVNIGVRLHISFFLPRA